MTCTILHVSLKEEYISITKLQGGGRENLLFTQAEETQNFWSMMTLTCMVISVKSRKILTCIDLHHTVSLNGGLDGCSSLLKAQYSQSTRKTPKIFGKKKIVSKNDCWNCSEKIHCGR